MNSKPILDFFQHLRLPLRKEGKDLLTFLCEHFLKFDEELGILLDEKSNDTYKQIYDELREKRGSIKDFSQALLDSLEYYRNGNILDAHLVFENKMDEMQDNLLGSETRSGGNKFYRIRPDKGNERKDLFHIPFDEAAKVKAYRYSVAGFPCLYLAGSKYVDTALSLSWFECGMPDEFYWSEFKIDKTVDPLYLIDFTETPFFGAKNPNDVITSALNNSPINEFIIKMITTYPLMAACSFVVEEKSQNFIPEYIIPQMLLGWVRKNRKYRGVAYFSCSAIKAARTYDAFNIALPPVEVMANGHCHKLKWNFKLSKPQKIDVSNIYKSLEKYYLQINSSYGKIYKAYQEFGFASLVDAKSICEHFLSIYPIVRDKKLQNIELAYQTIKTLNDFAQRVVEFKDSYRCLMAKQFEDCNLENRKLANLMWDESWMDIVEMRDTLGKFRNINLKKFDTTTNADDFQYIDSDYYTYCSSSVISGE